ncbi:unnamed protein product [Ceratitis capitata]|uniref:(Mediterranean fruit fly) hypothetical protein n=1 Tax=Ceratitis capitata TaxID=7213 RepID=A0A811TW29_CERCA|nr:unnamed protein product [Ceratitis capitata]
MERDKSPLHAEVVDLTPHYNASPALSIISSSSSISSSISSSSVTAVGMYAAATVPAFVDPYLDGYATANVTAQIGTHAYLPCRVSAEDEGLCVVVDGEKCKK